LVAWEDEPGWDTYTLVSGFQITGAKESKDEAKISVVFSVVGRMSGDGPIKEERKKEERREGMRSRGINIRTKRIEVA